MKILYKARENIIKSKRVIALALTAIMGLSVLLPTVAIAASSYSSQLGTNKALGSPLLNENFSYDEWNKWEMVAFGVFLSNFTQPMVDSYETAFTNNSKGSAGKGREALIFGTGSDSAGNKSLEGMLNYAITAQKNGIKPLKVKYTERNGENVVVGDWQEATIKDLMLYNKERSSISNVEGGPKIEDTTIKNIGGYNVEIITKSRLCELAVEGAGQGQYEKVFDWTNGYDAQMMGAWVSKVLNSEYSKIADKNLESAVKGNAKLYLDTFGNICCLIDGNYVVVVPAAMNCHIYKTERYNLLNSVLLSYGYSNASPSTLVNELDSKSDSKKVNTPLVTTGESIKNGDILVYFDTEHGIAEYVSNNYADVLNSDKSGISTNWGANLLKVLKSSLSGDTSNNTVAFRIEVVGATDGKGFFGSRFYDGTLKKLAQDIAQSTSMIAATYPINPRNDILNKVVTTKGEFPIFGTAAYVSVGMDSSLSADSGGKKATRNFINDMLHFIDGTSYSSQSGLEVGTSSELQRQLSMKNSIGEVAEWLWYGEDGKSSGKVAPLVKNSIVGGLKSKLKIPDNATNILSDSSIKWNELGRKDFQYILGKNFKDLDDAIIRTDDTAVRILKVHTQNAEMTNAMNVLNVREGTEFAIWTPYIYLTYLQWTGVVNSSEHNFNTALYSVSSDMLNAKIEDIVGNAHETEEEKDNAIRNLARTMLDPDKGREMRSQILDNWIADWIYKTYQDIVHGNSIKMSSGTGTETRISSGFLHLDTYEENFMTSWFIDQYAKYAIGLIGLLVLGAIIIGILNKKTFAWMLFSVFLIVNTVLLTPMAGEMAPYIANNVVQDMFSDKMTYWAMSESISNSKLEKELATQEENDIADGLTTTDFVRMLNIVYMDRSIMFRTDISKKINEDTTNIINDIQQLASARWLLPTIIRQFSASNGSADYVYVPLGDVYDNISNMYWVYMPNDRANVVSSKASLSGEVSDIPTVGEKNVMYSGYKETSMDITRSQDTQYLTKTVSTLDIDYGDSAYLDYTWNSVSREKPDEELPHTAFYLIPDIEVVNANGKWDDVMEHPENYIGSVDGFIEKAMEMEKEASSYEPNKEGAKVDYGFIWTTENPMHYFYQAVKDQFVSGQSVSKLIGELQGFYQVSPETGYDERNSFMHYRTSGDVRDIVDMEELFTNVIPYMYTVQLIAGGSNGENGILKDNKMLNYELYKDLEKSWLFRSNWATKLMEDSDLTKSAIVRDSNGKKHKVENPMLPSSYPIERPMIFSEAEKNAKGLRDSDLSLVELKILAVNANIEKSWTLLLNYANTPDISTEIFYRQMATEALIEFNKEFSPDRMINGSKALYPTSLDLRSISFDSVMKMLMINSTRDASYIYGDTMRQVVETTDIFTSLLLLISAFLCAYFIPFIRNVALGMLFFLGLWAVICNVFAGGRTKLKVCASFTISNAVYTALTLAYYAVFAMLIRTSTPDSVLSTGNTIVNAGPPTWQFFIIILASVVYISLSFKLLSFTIKNYRDMGFEVYAAWAGVLTNKVTKGIKGVKSKIGKGGAGSSASHSVGGNSSKGIGKDKASADSKDGEGSGKSTKSKKDKDPAVEAEKQYNSGSSGHLMSSVNEPEKGGKNIFDAEIEKGAKIEKQEKAKKKDTEK